MSDRATIIRMSTKSRLQQHHDHRLRDLVRRTGDLTIATDLGVSRSTARGSALLYSVEDLALARLATTVNARIPPWVRDGRTNRMIGRR